MIEELNKTRFDTKELGLIDSHFYENIFSVYKKDKHFIYNIIKRVTLPEGIVEDQFFDYKPITINAPWTLLSFHHYGTIKLWWLICVCNNITNTVNNCEHYDFYMNFNKNSANNCEHCDFTSFWTD